MDKAKLRIVFMGTPAFAANILKGLLDNDYNVVGVITAPDRPAGRGQSIKSSAVKCIAVQYKLKVLQPINLKADDFIGQLKDLKANLQIVVAFRMLPRVVWEMPAMGTFNLHASLLPQYRGAAPINWALINGETETGVTTFFLDDKIDTGGIILQSKVSISRDDTADSLHNKLMQLGQKLVIETIECILNEMICVKVQIENESLKSAPKLFKSNCKIDWSKTAEEIRNHIRGLNPYPGAWALLQNGTDVYNIKIYSILFNEISHSQEIGSVIADKSSIKVFIKNGYIHLLSFKFPGKKQMDAKDFLNGFSFDFEAKML